MASPKPGLTFLTEFYEGKGLGIMDNYAILFYGAISGKSVISSKVELFFCGCEIY
jgi:hypothetical protein